MMLHAYLMPHPPLAIPAVGRGEERKIAATLSAMESIAAEIAETAPKTIIFITPHNTVYTDYFHISPGPKANGGFSRFGAGDVQLEVKYNEALAAEIARMATASGLPAGFEGERNPTLDHGLMVPLWYIRQQYTDFDVIRISPSGLNPEAHYRMGQSITAAVQKHRYAPVVLIASGDLSHGLSDSGPYQYAPEGVVFDQVICDAFHTGVFQTLFDEAVPLREKAAECGLLPCIMLAGYCHEKQVESALLSYEGPFGVGYATAAVTAMSPYLAIARNALENRVLGNAPEYLNHLPDFLFNQQAGAFVSLHIGGKLRGCIGTIAPTADNIVLEIMQNAVSAGLRDPRFPPVTPDELPLLTYKVDILAKPEPISGPDALDVKRYGVIVTYQHRQGLLLPNLEGITTVEQQIDIARQKAGISGNVPVQLQRFEVTRHE